MLRYRSLLFAALLLALLPQAAAAKVLLSFHSFNGSVFFGRYPHTFIVLEGSLDKSGQAISENYGYSAQKATIKILRGATVPAMVYVEEPKYIASTNRHFTIPISDDQYWAIRSEIETWRTKPYNLETNSCIHFVARIAEMVGISADVPSDLLRQPRAWLNRVVRANPALHGKIFD